MDWPPAPHADCLTHLDLMPADKKTGKTLVFIFFLLCVIKREKLRMLSGVLCDQVCLMGDLQSIEAVAFP